jgi:MFS family permease
MNALERRAAVSLAAVFGLRMLGLFLILPVFSLYAEQLRGNTALLTGVAIGAYGLTQAILQIPFGLLSDRIGRKPVITGGLLIFAIGSVVAALADSITGVIIGRALQGAGAIAAAVVALASDLTREEQRTKAMAMIGMTIGAAFFLSLVLGPLLDRIIGVPGMFWMTAVLALLGIIIVNTQVPTPASSHVPLGDDEGLAREFRKILSNGQLLRLDWGIFSLHLVLTALFVAVPFSLLQGLEIQRESHWMVYLPIILLSVLGMLPLVMLTTRKHLVPHIQRLAIVLLLAGELMLYGGSNGPAWLFLAGLVIWFTGFNVLESLLPSLVSRLAPTRNKGAAIGVYNSAEFFGAFLGGVLGGLALGSYGEPGVYLLCAAVLALWLLLVTFARPPRLLDSRVLRVDPRQLDGDALAAELTRIPGVDEAVVIAEKGVVFLKIDSEMLDEAALDKYASGLPAGT